MKDWTNRFYSKIRLDASGCWIWTGGKNNKGYGSFTIGEARECAHRVAYRLHRGVIRHELDHLCRNRACVNPAHLEDVTHSVNLLRGSGNGCRERTHCKAGHEFTHQNTYLRPNGCRQCRECGRRAVRSYQARKKAMA